MHKPDAEWCVLPDAEMIARAGAEMLVAALEHSGERASVCLTGGGTVAGLYRLLATPEFRARIAWPRVHWFVTDERFVAADDALSNMGQARRLLLDACALRENVHAVETGATDPVQAAALYETELRAFERDALDPARPLFDVVLLGVGADGHVASLFPGHNAANERERWCVAEPNPGLNPRVPRVTLTMPALRSCSRMLIMVSGGAKAKTIARVVAGEDLPAARVQAGRDAAWLIDEAAAAQVESLRRRDI